MVGMYLGLMLIIFAVVAVIAGVASGGIFTIVLIPLAVIAVVSAAAFGGFRHTLGWVRTADEQDRQAANLAAPHGEMPVTPDEYVDALREAQ
jgi:hypothetical protein